MKAGKWEKFILDNYYNEFDGFCVAFEDYKISVKAVSATFGQKIDIK